MPKYNIRQSIRIDYEDVTHADGALNGFRTGGFFREKYRITKILDGDFIILSSVLH